MRTTNMLERQNKEIKRRTRVATLFPTKHQFYALVPLFSSNSLTNGKPGCGTSPSTLETNPTFTEKTLLYPDTIAMETEPLAERDLVCTPEDAGGAYGFEFSDIIGLGPQLRIANQLTIG